MSTDEVLRLRVENSALRDVLKDVLLREALNDIKNGAVKNSSNGTAHGFVKKPLDEAPRTVVSADAITDVQPPPEITTQAVVTEKPRRARRGSRRSRRSYVPGAGTKIAQVLEALKTGPLTSIETGDALNMPMSTASGILSRLYQLRLVTRAPLPASEGNSVSYRYTLLPT